jgi:hypothetical protein
VRPNLHPATPSLRVTLPLADPPLQVDAFWSITMYDLPDFY